MTFAFGGDVGNTKEADSITSNLATFKPQVIVIGGDISYDNALCGCILTWDFLMNSLEEVNEQLNLIVPWILTVGNHDVGLNSLARRNLTKEEKIIPYF